jgi:hypothetical protein
VTLRASLILTADAKQFKGEVGQAGAAMRELGGEAQAAGRTVANSFSTGLSSIRDRIAGAFATAKASISSGGGQMRYAVTNVANQVQDAFVQLAAGASPLLVIGQQLPQALQSLGPVGTIAGAAVAAAALALGRMGDAGTAARDAITGLEGAMRALDGVVGDSSDAVGKQTAHYAKLGAEFQKLGAAKLALDQRDLNKELEAGSRALAATVAELERLTQVQGPIAERTGRGALAPGLAADVRATIEAFRASGDVAGLVTSLADLDQRGGGALHDLATRASDLADAMAEARQKGEQAGSIRQSLEQMAAGGTQALSQLNQGLKGTRDATEATTRAFEQMYQDVVGGSYVPDLVTEAGTWFDQLRTDMTTKTTEATSAVSEAFAGLDRQVSYRLGSMIAHNKLALQDFAAFAQDVLGQVLGNLISVGLNAGISAFFAPSSSFAGGGGGGLSGSVGADTLHSGGIAGSPGNLRTTVPLSLFAGAPRLHGGGQILRAGEVPAILQAGEPVLPRGARVGGTQIVNVIDQRQGGAPITTRERRGAGGEQILDVMVRDRVSSDIMRGAHDKALRTRFGLEPAIATR